jgi:hypothetical protein
VHHCGHFVLIWVFDNFGKRSLIRQKSMFQAMVLINNAPPATVTTKRLCGCHSDPQGTHHDGEDVLHLAR